MCPLLLLMPGAVFKAFLFEIPPEPFLSSGCLEVASSQLQVRMSRMSVLHI